MKLEDIVAASAEMAATRARGARARRVAELVSRAGPEAGTVAAWLTGTLVQGRIGLGWAGVAAVLEALGPAPREATLEVVDVERAVTAIMRASGPGSVTARKAALEALLARATPPERDFVARLLVGEMRHGAQDGIVQAGLALAFEAAERDVRRAVMLAGSLPTIAQALAREGAGALARYRLEPFRAVMPMLADTAEDLGDVEDLGAWVLEAKLDGARIQVHKDGVRVAVYTRALNEVTAAVPEIVELARDLTARRLVLDGEVLAIDGAGRPQPFQVTMRRFGRKLNVDDLRAQIPLTPLFFDALLVDDDDLLDAPLATRRARLAAVVPEASRVPSLVSPTLAAARDFLAATLSAGHEGLVVKRLDSTYEAGSRGASWLKLKPAKTLDLVVLAVEQGSGRRSRWLSNLHLGAYDPTTGGFVMLGKTFKGLTDELLEWQTRELGAREVGREGHVVYVRPELVVEIAYQELEVSPRYPGGLALRFARVRGYRPDKRPTDADTLAAVRAAFARQRAGAGGAEGAEDDKDGGSPSGGESV
ncbi:MAG: ATP-dependent DNA ligase [Deltaproteobacteria bacterium]|nr:ATP-dependent DNA ligase [Deltaproteobacteria bacterium]